MAEATKIKTMVQQIIQKEYSSNNITEMKWTWFNIFKLVLVSETRNY